MLPGTKPIKFTQASWNCTPSESFGKLTIDISPKATANGKYIVAPNQSGELYDLKYVESQIGEYRGKWKSTQTGKTGSLVFWLGASGRDISGNWTYDGKPDSHPFTGKLIPESAVLERSNVWFGVGGSMVEPTAETGVVRKTATGFLNSCDKFGNRFELSGEGQGHGFHGGLGSAAFNFFLVTSLYDPKRFKNVIWGETEWGVLVPAAKAAKLLLKAKKYIELFNRIKTLVGLYKAGTKVLARTDWDEMRNDVLTLVLDSEMEMNANYPQFSAIDIGVELVAISFVYTKVCLKSGSVSFTPD